MRIDLPVEGGELVYDQTFEIVRVKSAQDAMHPNVPNGTARDLIPLDVREELADQHLQEVDWDELRGMLTEFRRRPAKDGPAWLPVALKDPAQWVLSPPSADQPEDKITGYRYGENVESISLLVLDLDQPGGLERAREVFSNRAWIAHSSHSYDPSTAPYKHRFIVPLAEPIPADAWPDIYAAMAVVVGADPVCRNLARIYYEPSTPHGQTFIQESKSLRTLSVEDIAVIQAAARHVDLEYMERARAARRSTVGKPNGPRHFFDGTVIEGSRKGAPEPASSAYRARHALSLNELEKTDSRHNFAVSASWREVMHYRADTDVRTFVTWLSAETHYLLRKGSVGRGIFSRGSDTASELPRILTDAFAFHGIQAPESLESDIAEGLAHGREIAERIDSDPLYSIPMDLGRGAENSSPAQLADPLVGNVSRDELLARHRKAIHTLHESGGLRVTGSYAAMLRVEENLSEEMPRATRLALVQLLISEGRQHFGIDGTTKQDYAIQVLRCLWKNAGKIEGWAVCADGEADPKRLRAALLLHQELSGKANLAENLRFGDSPQQIEVRSRHRQGVAASVSP